METTDTELLDMWIRHRDAEALAAICEKYARLPFRAGLRILGNAADAEEIAQECFEGLAGLKQVPSGPIGARLHKVATYRALNRRRGEHRRRHREQKYGDSQRARREVGWDDIYEHVDEAVAALPEKLRTAVIAHFFEQQTHEAIARREGISRAAISQRVKQGLEQVRKTLKRKGIVVEALAMGLLLKENLAYGSPVPASLHASLGKLSVSGATLPAPAGLLIFSGLGGLKAVIVGVSILTAGILMSLYGATERGTSVSAVDKQRRVRIAPVEERVLSGIEAASAGSEADQGALRSTEDSPRSPVAVDNAPDKQQDLDRQKLLGEILDTLDDIFAASTTLWADKLSPGGTDEDGVLPSTRGPQVETVEVGSPAWRRTLIANGKDPDAPDHKRAREHWKTRAERATRVPRTPLSYEEATQIAGRHRVPVQQMPELARVLAQYEEVPFDIYATQGRALAISYFVELNGERLQPAGFLVFDLSKTEDSDWVVEDIDVEDDSGVVDSIEKLVERFPGAILLTE